MIVYKFEQWHAGIVNTFGCCHTISPINLLLKIERKTLLKTWIKTLTGFQSFSNTHPTFLLTYLHAILPTYIIITYYSTYILLTYSNHTSIWVLGHTPSTHKTHHLQLSLKPQTLLPTKRGDFLKFSYELLKTQH